MEIYLWRHAQAEARSPTGRDEDRRLTGQGKDELVRVTRKVLRSQPRVQKIFTSPLQRARETSYVLELMFECEQGIQVLSELAEESPVDDIAKKIRAMGDWESLILVGHMPSLGKMADYYLGYGAGQIYFHPASVMKIQIRDIQDPFEGEMEFYIRPGNSSLGQA